MSMAAAVLFGSSTSAFSHIRPGVFLTKEAPASDDKTAEKMLATLTTELASITELMATNKTAMEKQYSELTNHFGGLKGDNEALKLEVKKRSDEYAEMVQKHQALGATLDSLKRELNAPIIVGGKDLVDADRKNAVELQRRAFLYKGGIDDDFKPDMENLVIAKDYRSAARKLAKAGIETREAIIRTFDVGERKAFDAASMDSAFFMPEMLGIEIDCNIECAELIDLYASVSVTKSSFMYPQIVDYGAIGKYDCDAKCDAELGPEGNIRYVNGKTHDFRGVFCFQKKVLTEANYDLLSFMFRAAARSYRLNRNRALIAGDGLNEPLGWLRADCFKKLKTGATTFNHQDFRRFIASAPVEYGKVVATMHQNVFGYLASALDANGRFIFGDGLMTYSPDDTRERLRISNCLPDPTHGGTRGSDGAPFVAGDFIAAAGNWNAAYAAVSKKPMFMEQYVGGSSAWCVKYQFGAEDGGFVMCCPAARTLVVGP
jgi:HK97 family phage major capsid protein